MSDLKQSLLLVAGAAVCCFGCLISDGRPAASASIVVDAPADVEVKRYVVGRDVGGESIAEFVDSRAEIADRLDSGTLLYRAG